jgi:predicted RNase H-like HicB family nuclease
MKAEVTALIEHAPEGGFWATCPEIPGANGQGETIDEARQSLREAIELIIHDRVDDYTRGLPSDVICEKLFVS